MTKQNQLLKLLDNVFGFESIRNSSLRKINQDSKRKGADIKSLNLIRSINGEVNTRSRTGKTLETK
jgi:hypothetical protein